MFWNDKTKKKKTARKFLYHGIFCYSQRSAKSNTVTKQREILFLNEGFVLRINVYILLHGLKSIMKKQKKNGKRYTFLMKKLLEEFSLTHEESMGNSERKGTLNNNIYYIWPIVAKKEVNFCQKFIDNISLEKYEWLSSSE